MLKEIRKRSDVYFRIIKKITVRFTKNLKMFFTVKQ